MIDLPAAVRTRLAANATLVGLVDTRIYAEQENPPAGYTPNAGPCLCFKFRGGAVDYTDAVFQPSVQFRCIAKDTLTANRLYRALYDALHSQHGGTVRWGQIEMLGETLTDPETGWPFVLCAFRLHVAG